MTGRRPVIAALSNMLPRSETPQRPSGHVAISERYVEAIERAGGRVVLIPAIPGTEIIEPEELLDGVDGVCLIGGGDLDPATYGQHPHELGYGFNGSRDAMEISLAKYCIANDVPLLGICRGCQVINVALGGTLHQHIGDIAAYTSDHGRPQELATGMHEVLIEASSRLEEAVGAPTATNCTSAHHQSVDQLGRGLVITGRSPDGCVEAVEALDDDAWVLGLQWHPEINAGEDSQQQSVFNALVAQSVERRRNAEVELRSRVVPISPPKAQIGN